MMAHRPRRRPNINPTLNQHFMFAGINMLNKTGVIMGISCSSWNAQYHNLSKHEKLKQCCYNVGSTSTTLALHYNNTGSMPPG